MKTTLSVFFTMAALATAAPFVGLGSGQTCGGLAGLGCPSGETCRKATANLNCADCMGTCVSMGSLLNERTPQFDIQIQECGGNSGLNCPGAKVCVFNPDKPDCKECAGVCVTPKTCGGFFNTLCDNQDDMCVDDPTDPCDPAKGAEDCPGLCVSPKAFA
ncbi:hypothetical protein TWF694_003336 [Orbilia ellipsospora]|uniref:Uncharacterized protein n=1 Tax=Orbilia ellipsospora TaxID=2528407 RepID=A0AAV9X1E6_9PEZI